MTDHSDETIWQTTTSNLVGGNTVTFDTPDTTANDTPTPSPVDFWLRAFPTSDETAPD